MGDHRSVEELRADEAIATAAAGVDATVDLSEQVGAIGHLLDERLLAIDATLVRIADALEKMVDRKMPTENDASTLPAFVSAPATGEAMRFASDDVVRCPPGEITWLEAEWPRCMWNCRGCTKEARNLVIKKPTPARPNGHCYMCDNCAAVFDPFLGATSGYVHDFIGRRVLVRRAAES